MGHGMRLDYGLYAKRGLALGIGLLVVGLLGNALGPVVVGSLPAVEETVLSDLMGLGILVGFASVFGFGILLPLTE
ncbi:MAG: hypothetical protein ABEJ68_10955 [Halobacteriaceae archaeon]